MSDSRVLSAIQRQICRIYGKCVWVSQPFGCIFKNRALTTALSYLTATTHYMRITGMIDVDFDGVCHDAPSSGYAAVSFWAVGLHQYLVPGY